MNIFITGVSSGIGHALSKQYLDRGDAVYGVSRREPEDLASHERFHFRPLDVADHERTPGVLTELFAGADRLELVILNAGILGRIGDMREIDLDEQKHVLDINLWANKTILDTLIDSQLPLRQVVAISSGASVSGNRGWAAYSISKAALNMLVKLYSRELPDVHFCALAPGIIDTEIQEELARLPDDERFPAAARLKAKRGTADMPEPGEAARTLIRTIDSLPEQIPSGDYADIRQEPLAS